MMMTMTIMMRHDKSEGDDEIKCEGKGDDDSDCDGGWQPAASDQEPPAANLFLASR